LDPDQTCLSATAAHGAVGEERQAEGLTLRERAVVDRAASIAHVEAVLHAHDRRDGDRTIDLLRVDVREADVLDLAFGP
jgi:hypothetical protein